MYYFPKKKRIAISISLSLLYLLSITDFYCWYAIFCKISLLLIFCKSDNLPKLISRILWNTVPRHTQSLKEPKKKNPEQYYCENEVWQNKTKKKIETIIVEQKKEKKLQKKATHNYTWTHIHTDEHTQKTKNAKKLLKQKITLLMRCRKKYKIIISVQTSCYSFKYTIIMNRNIGRFKMHLKKILGITSTRRSLNRRKGSNRREVFFKFNKRVGSNNSG